MIQSQRRANFDSPISSAPVFGRTPIHIFPMIGQRWCEQALRTVIGPTIINWLSRDTLGKLVIGGAARYRPAHTSSLNIVAPRRAVPTELWPLSVSTTSAPGCACLRFPHDRKEL